MVRNLKELQKRKTMYGPGASPLFLLNQIADLRSQIRQEVQGELRRLQGVGSAEADAGDRERIGRIEALLASVQTGGSAAAAAGPEAGTEVGLPFAVQILQPQDGDPQVLVHRSWAGDTGPQPLELPYAGEALDVVMRALATPVGRVPVDRFTAAELARLEDWGLVGSGHVLARMYEVVGRALYRALFPPEIARVFHAARSRARSEQRALALRLIFDAGAATLASYPWELIHDDVPLVADGVVDLTRYIAFPGPRAALDVGLPLRVLGIAPRPSGLPALPRFDEPGAVAEGLASLAARDALALTWLSPPTRQALLGALQRADVHVIHFDGHGSFGRLCPACGVLYTATSARCTRCQYPLTTVEARGYLAFEDEGGGVNYVSARSLANALSRSRTQVVVLSACRSGQVGGGRVFNGVGPALIRAGVPAVVAMQLPIRVADAACFARTFYTSLADFEPLVEAVGRGRQPLYDETRSPQAWFVPTLYLRSDDPRGDLFQHEAS
jgi:hypothetical protein